MVRHIVKDHKYPEVVWRFVRRQIIPVIGKLPIQEIRPAHVDKVLSRIV
jgi:hypothetical protein